MTSKCPKCNQFIKFAHNVLKNVETYGKTVLSVTECCGYGMYVSRNLSFNIVPYEGNRTEDDWGDPIKHGNFYQSEQNDALGEKGLAFVEAGEYHAALALIRNQTNPLIAAWLVTFLCENVSESNKQFKNWIANATYNEV